MQGNTFSLASILTVASGRLVDSRVIAESARLIDHVIGRRVDGAERARVAPVAAAWILGLDSRLQAAALEAQCVSEADLPAWLDHQAGVFGATRDVVPIAAAINKLLAE